MFKLNPDWTRDYLENENRQAEISRLSELAEADCETDPESRKQQKEGATELSKRLNITSITPREKIGKMGKMGKPTTRSEAEKIGEYQDYLDKNCPEVGYQDMWIADWIFFN